LLKVDSCPSKGHCEASKPYAELTQLPVYTARDPYGWLEHQMHAVSEPGVQLMHDDFEVQSLDDRPDTHAAPSSRPAQTSSSAERPRAEEPTMAPGWGIAKQQSRGQ